MQTLRLSSRKQIATDTFKCSWTLERSKVEWKIHLKGSDDLAIIISCISNYIRTLSQSIKYVWSCFVIGYPSGWPSYGRNSSGTIRIVTGWSRWVRHSGRYRWSWKSDLRPPSGYSTSSFALTTTSSSTFMPRFRPSKPAACYTAEFMQTDGHIIIFLVLSVDYRDFLSQYK